MELLVGQTVRLRTMALRSGGQLGARTVIEKAPFGDSRHLSRTDPRHPARGQNSH